MLYMHLSLPPYCTQKIMFGSEWVLLMVVCVLELHGASKNCDIGKYKAVVNFHRLKCVDSPTFCFPLITSTRSVN